MATKNYIGFHTLEKLLQSADRSRPIDAMPVTDPGKPGKFGISLDRHLIMVSQAQPTGEVLYCRIVTAKYQAMAGHGPLDPNNKYAERTHSGWRIVQDEIRARGFDLREGMVSMPKGFQYLDGDADCLRYNKETDLFERSESVPA